ncbi:PEP-utilizing enzyme [Nocardia sp. CA-107356]|uniref:PEP-utilizing enzyme n=1 Tax=Nocardia sp. CA-107356 TaxID=3239972 RepID=UPI003D8AC5CA
MSTPTTEISRTVVDLGTKAQTLQSLAPLLRHAEVLPLMYFTVADWAERRDELLDELATQSWAGGPLIVRSSTVHEDAADTQEAGRYNSEANVVGREAITAAIERVVSSYTEAGQRAIDRADEILVQPMAPRVTRSGVVFSGDPNTGAAYIVVNYNDGADTAAVTGGRGTSLRTFYYWKPAQDSLGDDRMARLLALTRELEALTGEDLLDVEFAFGEPDRLYLLQVRRLLAAAADPVRTRAHQSALHAAAAKLARDGRHPTLLGRRTLLGVMPDWNPAEIIGIRPRPLALSLYRRLITNQVWADQRHRYGYRDVRGCPLMIDLAGLPYIDVRASFNSLLPADLDDAVAARVVDLQLDRLAAEPALHDKVEFEIVQSCFTFDTREQSRARFGPALTDDEHHALAESLLRLTNQLLDPAHPARVEDDENLRSLEQRWTVVKGLDLDPVAEARWLLHDCARYGTPAFSGYARLGFIAVELLRSIVRAGVLSRREADQFVSGLHTVTNEMSADRAALSTEEFLRIYGHLRPGTYNICSPRYDQAPHLYFTSSTETHNNPPPKPFEPNISQLHTLDDLASSAGLEHGGAELVTFIGDGIIGRENSKFAFTRHLSEALSAISRLGAERGLSPEDCSYLDVRVIEELYQGTGWAPEELRRGVENGHETYALTRQIVLPPLLTRPQDVFAFHQPHAEPSFITQASVTAPLIPLDIGAPIDGKILLLPSGDPGYDWIYSHRIAGVITAYGGVNSHMAIRAHQFGVPAVLGVGETTYQALRESKMVAIDCTNRRIEILR